MNLLDILKSPLAEKGAYFIVSLIAIYFMWGEIRQKSESDAKRLEKIEIESKACNDYMFNTMMGIIEKQNKVIESNTEALLEIKDIKKRR